MPGVKILNKAAKYLIFNEGSENIVSHLIDKNDCILTRM